MKEDEKMLEYDVVERGVSHVVLQLRGELSGGQWAGHLRRSLEEHFVDDGVKLIRVDLGSLNFLDSEGVATLVCLKRESSKRGKAFRVEGVDGQVDEKLRVMGVLQKLQDEN